MFIFERKTLKFWNMKPTTQNIYLTKMKDLKGQLAMRIEIFTKAMSLAVHTHCPLWTSVRIIFILFI